MPDGRRRARHRACRGRCRALCSHRPRRRPACQTTRCRLLHGGLDQLSCSRSGPATPRASLGMGDRRVSGRRRRSGDPRRSVAPPRSAPLSTGACLTRKFSANCRCTSAPVARDLRLASGEGMPGLEVPQLEGDHVARPRADQPSQRATSAGLMSRSATTAGPASARAAAPRTRQSAAARSVEQDVDRRGGRGPAARRAPPRPPSQTPGEVEVTCPHRGSRAPPRGSRAPARRRAASGARPRRAEPAASVPRRWSNAICPRRCSASALRRSSSGPASIPASSPRAASSAPASRLARAAASRRRDRRPGRASGSQRARGTRPRRPAPRGPGHDRPRARAPRRHPRRAPAWPGPGARRDGRAPPGIGDLGQRAVHVLPFARR